MNHKARVSVALTTTLAVLALGGCGQSITDPDASGPATTEVETYVPTPYVDTPAETEAPSEEAQWLSGPSEQAEGTSRTSLLAHDFRVGVHEDYYRVVVEFVGQGDPGWTVGWTDKSVEVGRGDAPPLINGWMTMSSPGLTARLSLTPTLRSRAIKNASIGCSLLKTPSDS